MGLKDYSKVTAEEVGIDSQQRAKSQVWQAKVQVISYILVQWKQLQ